METRPRRIASARSFSARVIVPLVREEIRRPLEDLPTAPASVPLVRRTDVGSQLPLHLRPKRAPVAEELDTTPSVHCLHSQVTKYVTGQKTG